MGQIQRRQFMIAAGGIVVAYLARAQQEQKIRRIGYLSPEVGESEPGRRNQRLLRESLRRAGYEEGKDLAIEWRFAEGNPKLLQEFATDLVRRNVELIVAVSNASIASAATRTIPIVMYFGFMPVETGIVQSLARPGGNVTGTAWTSPELAGKLLQILKEAVPRLTRVAVLWNPSSAANIYTPEAERSALALGVTRQYFGAKRREEIPTVLERISASRPDALEIMYDPTVIGSRLREVTSFAIKHKLVSIGTARAVVNTGGLLYYGPDPSDIADQTVGYIDRILRGAKPADMPVQQPRKYEFVINAKTATAIGYKVPTSLLMRADQVIE